MHPRFLAATTGIALALIGTAGCTSQTNTTTSVRRPCGIVYGSVTTVADLTTTNTVQVKKNSTLLLVLTHDCRTNVTLSNASGLTNVSPATHPPTTAYFATVGTADGRFDARIGSQVRTINVHVE